MRLAARLFKEGRLLPERREALLGIGFCFGKPRREVDHDHRFTPKQREVWEKMYQELMDFKEIFGHCRVTFDETTYRPLGKWVHRQRSDFTNGRMDRKREERLNAIGFEWRIKS